MSRTGWGRQVAAWVIAAGALALALHPAPARAGAVLDAIKARGTLRCGVLVSAGASTPDSNGNWQGFNVDLCRALAIALFNDPAKAQFVPGTREQRFTLLQTGQVDVLFGGVTQTVTRTFQLGFHFGPVLFYDGQGFMVPKSLNVSKATELDGATVCVLPGTTTELNLADYFREHNITYKPVVAEEYREVLNAFSSGRCDVLTQDASALFGTRAQLPNPDNYTVLPERISKEPIASAVRFGDDQLQEIVTWVLWSVVQAEEFGISRDTVDAALQSPNPAIRRFLGVEPGIGAVMGLDGRWAYRVVKALGNYGEIFERNYGQQSPLKFERGLNQLWTKGGLIYAPPFR